MEGGRQVELKQLALDLVAFEQVDKSDFQRQARVLQSMWREEQGYECGTQTSRGLSRPLGSRLAMPWARETLANFLTDETRAVVRREVLDPVVSADKLYGKPRIFEDLLSSQPLCFNLFAELRQQLTSLSVVIADLTDGRFSTVRAIEFEHSPGRRDPHYLGDRSAFDVYLECNTRNGEPGFVGIEVKYHENLRGPAGANKRRYDEVASMMGCFVPASLERLKTAPLQQIWRDHLLAGVTRIVDKYADGLFVMLYPALNRDVADATKAYSACLSSSSSFAAWTLEDFTRRLQRHAVGPWLERFVDRYLAFGKVDQRLGVTREMS